MATPVKIDPEFKDLIAPCTTEELAAIRQSIVDVGLLSPLIVWEETGILLDGHNRYEICLEIKYKPKAKKDWTFISLPDRKAARLWILENQIARRNLNGDQLSILRGEIYSAKKQSAPFQEVLVGQNDLPGDGVAEVLAEQFGVSASTIKRDEQFSHAVAALPAPVKAVVRAGKSPVPRKAIVEGTVFCQKCSRVGPVKNCPQCDGLRAQINVKKRNDRAAKPKSGSMKYDWDKFKTNFGVVARAADAIAKGYEEPKTADSDYRKAYDALEDYLAIISAWKKRLTGEKL